MYFESSYNTFAYYTSVIVVKDFAEFKSECQLKGIMVIYNKFI